MSDRLIIIDITHPGLARRQASRLAPGRDCERLAEPCRRRGRDFPELERVACRMGEPRPALSDGDRRKIFGEDLAGLIGIEPMRSVGIR